jgi:hypothetical protein
MPNENKISKSEARKYILNFVEKFYDSTVLTVGGFISRLSFQDLGFGLLNYDGLIAWYCIDGHGIPDFYLAFGRDTNYDRDKPYENFPPNLKEYFFKTNEAIRIKKKYSAQEIEKELLDGAFSAPKLEQKIKDREVRDGVAQFKSSNYSQFIKYPIGFFPMENFNELLEQDDLIGVRYFFGFDSTLEVNNIRMVSWSQK